MIESSVVVRPAAPDGSEAEPCIDLWAAAVAARDGVDEDPAVRARARTKFAAPHVAWLVVPADDGSIDGFVLVTAPGSGRPSDPADAAYLSMLAVRPGVEARGVGRSLLAEAVHDARAAGHGRVVLHVLGDNARAVRLYEAGGFVPTGDEFAHALSGVRTRVYVTA
ncbi:GNAT family N-acetyltransferase [Curtobacterium sp. PhB115]|uniref:GNAT family N-acetyltransferase n=1 Tax=Curtobacterium sp. PhB115 TaxID=2485173 RepID=UPI000FB1931D|nr:GNAT family N-acetyltransferase [Curtobacterium sp. PhB115]ROP65424.1 acetyltransferase (GNAT) family protein [Curtobacterium sp. PhB115]